MIIIIVTEIRQEQENDIIIGKKKALNKAG